MLHPPSPLSPSNSGLLPEGALPFLAAVVTGLLGFFGARLTATAPLQGSLNDAFRSLMGEYQTEHARLTALASDLLKENTQLRGNLAQEQQKAESLVRIALAHGVKLPDDML